MQSLQSNSTPKIGPDQLSKFGLGLGVVMMIIGFVWVEVVRGHNALAVWFSAEPLTIIVDVGIGLGVGAGIALSVATLGNRVEGFAHIRNTLALRLDLARFRWWHCVWLSVLAAAPEEILFRGAMQPVLGLVLTAIIFGVLHAVTRLYFIYATAAGLLLGLLYQYNETLWLPMAAHFAVDYFSLVWLANWARQQIPPADPLQDWMAYGIVSREDELETF